MKQVVIGVIAWLVYRVLSCTWRITWREPEPLRSALRERRPFIVAHWHGDGLALLPSVKRYRLVTLTSRSKDGRIMATLLKLLGASVTCDRAHHLHRAWDRAFLPKAFARLQIEWRGPMQALTRADDPRDPLLLDRLEQLMLQAKREAQVPGQQAVPEAAVPEHTAL